MAAYMVKVTFSSGTNTLQLEASLPVVIGEDEHRQQVCHHSGK